jgi:hypothetical protein
VRHIKEMIHDIDGVPVDQQRVFHDEKPLEDDNTLGSYNIQTGAILRLALNLRGGGGGGGRDGGGGGGGGGGGLSGSGSGDGVGGVSTPQTTVRSKESVFVKDSLEGVAMIFEVGGGEEGDA